MSPYDLLRRSTKMAGSVMEVGAHYSLQPLHYGNRCDIFKMEKKTPEAIRLNSVSKSVRIFSFICLLAMWIPNALADPVSELASFSVFDKVDLGALAKGDPTVAHGTPMGGRYISAQSCFVVAAPPLRVAEALSRWNPARHPELKVLLHSDLPSSPGPANFSELSKAPDNAAVRSLVSATQALSTN